MQVFINGAAREFPASLALAELVERLELGARRIAVERNGEIVPRSTWATTPVADGDRLEIVVAVGGG
jgi:sulfur carrier protein